MSSSESDSCQEFEFYDLRKDPYSGPFWRRSLMFYCSLASRKGSINSVNSVKLFMVESVIAHYQLPFSHISQLIDNLHASDSEELIGQVTDRAFISVIVASFSTSVDY